MSHFTGTWREVRKLVLNRVLALRKIDKKGSVVSRLPSLAEIRGNSYSAFLFVGEEENRCFNRAMALFPL